MIPVINHSPSRRVGPLERLDRGQYKGQRVEDIIRKSPQYIMYCIREWLDVSPSQALLFEDVTGGGIIPDCYIKEFSLPRRTRPEGWTSRDENLYNSNQDILPNWDFFPEEAPEWWEEFKSQPEYRGTPSQRVDLYNKYIKAMWKQAIKEMNV